MEKYWDMILKKYCEVFCKITEVINMLWEVFCKTFEKFPAKILNGDLQKHLYVVCKNTEK